MLPSVTLRPEVSIPLGAMPAAGVNGSDIQEVADLSAAYVDRNGVELQYTEIDDTGLVSFELIYHNGEQLPPGAQVQWNFGDGSVAVGTALTQSHQYAPVGVYYASVVIVRPPESSMSPLAVAVQPGVPFP